MKITVGSLKHLIKEHLMSEAFAGTGDGNATFMKNIDAIIKAGIEEHTDRSVASLQMHADPKVEGSYAIRASMDDGETIDFVLLAHWLLKSQTLTPSLVDENLEEVEFTSWPPSSGNMQFF